MSYVKILCNFCTYVLKAQRELLPDAEVGEDITEHFIVCYFADDFAKVVDGSGESLHSTAFTTKNESASGTEVDDIYCAIDELPGNAGKVMRLLFSGQKYIEIAVRMEIPIGTVKTRINISRSILKQRLKDYLN